MEVNFCFKFLYEFVFEILVFVFWFFAALTRPVPLLHCCTDLLLDILLLVPLLVWLAAFINETEELLPLALSVLRRFAFERIFCSLQFFSVIGFLALCITPNLEDQDLYSFLRHAVFRRIMWTSTCVRSEDWSRCSSSGTSQEIYRPLHGPLE